MTFLSSAGLGVLTAASLLYAVGYYTTDSVSPPLPNMPSPTTATGVESSWNPSAYKDWLLRQSAYVTPTLLSSILGVALTPSSSTSTVSSATNTAQHEFLMGQSLNVSPLNLSATPGPAYIDPPTGIPFVTIAPLPTTIQFEDALNVTISEMQPGWQYSPMYSYLGGVLQSWLLVGMGATVHHLAQVA